MLLKETCNGKSLHNQAVCCEVTTVWVLALVVVMTREDQSGCFRTHLPPMAVTLSRVAHPVRFSLFLESTVTAGFD